MLGYALQVRTRGRAAYRRLRDRVFAYGASTPHAPPISSGCTLCPVRGTTPRRALADKERLLELDERRARARANLLAVAATEQLEAAVRAEQQAEAKVRAGWRLAAQQRGSGAGSLVVFLFVSSCCCSPAAEASSAG